MLLVLLLDIVVHRLLAACIDKNEVLLSADLLDRVKVVEMCENANYRHRMAQQAGRSSVELYTNIFFRGKIVDEVGYVTRVLKNGFSVLVPKYGIEGFVYASNRTESPVMANSKSRAASFPSPPKPAALAFSYNSELHSLHYGDICIRVLSKVTIQISIDEGSIAGLRQRLRMSLVHPVIPGLSVAKKT